MLFCDDKRILYNNINLVCTNMLRVRWVFVQINKNFGHSPSVKFFIKYCPVSKSNFRYVLKLIHEFSQKDRKYLFVLPFEF
jgi:hypothetical protein